MPTAAVADVAKKEKKEKKKSSKKTKTADDTAAEGEPKHELSSPEPKSKKRKRIALPEEGELEVDVNAPEPLSKKELRRAKKGKLTPKPTAKSDPDSDAEDDSGTTRNKAEKSDHGIWIGNLPWTATKESLRAFLVEHASISDTQITRVHMPAPEKNAVAHMRIKPQNKGFAYVDFDSQAALDATIGVSETLMGGRRVLIKNAKSYEGRPAKETGDGAESALGTSKTLAMQASGGKEPSRRVFVGNLAFDVTKEDLTEHYQKCGDVADVHMATFQDTGKCKGYAWVTFEGLEAAAAAVAGFTRIPIEDDDSEEEVEDAAEDGDEDAAEAKKKQKKPKTRKWFVNRLAGRQLRVEFAEDAATRYKKRYGKDAKSRDGHGGEDGADGEFGEVAAKRQGGRREPRKIDARTIKPGAALANAPRASGAIVEAKGTKITFD